MYLLQSVPPFVPSAVIASAAAVIRSYGLSAVHGDRWAEGLIAEKFAEHGILYTYTEMPTSGFYAQLPALLTSSAVRLLDSDRLVGQIASLRRKLGSQGQEVITHPGKAHDDLATAATVALVLVRARGAPQSIEEEEAQRPEGSFERPAREAGSRYERLVLERYGPAKGAALIANARAMADGDPTVFNEYLLDALPEHQRMARGLSPAGL